jgi:hypothetical protein
MDGSIKISAVSMAVQTFKTIKIGFKFYAMDQRRPSPLIPMSLWRYKGTKGMDETAVLDLLTEVQRITTGGLAQSARFLVGH